MYGSRNVRYALFKKLEWSPDNFCLKNVYIQIDFKKKNLHFIALCEFVGMDCCLFLPKALLQLFVVQFKMRRNAKIGEIIRLFKYGLDLSAICAMHLLPAGQLFVALPTSWWVLLAAQIAALTRQ